LFELSVTDAAPATPIKARRREQAGKTRHGRQVAIRVPGIISHLFSSVALKCKACLFSILDWHWNLPLSLLRPGPLLWKYERRQGNGNGGFRELWPISVDFPALGNPAMEFTDRVLKCNDCGAEFVFTAGEQLFFHDKQFKNDPKHCKQCKAKRLRGGPRVRSETRTTCSQCGAETTVPFKPTQGRPVLCRSCFQKQGGAAPAVVPAD